MGMEAQLPVNLSPEAKATLDKLISLLAKDRYGTEGPPRDTTFAEIEDYGHQAGRLVARRLDERLAGEHARHFQDASPCPTCKYLCVQEPDPHQLEMQTKDGPVTLDEPTFRCPTCDRAFFPSARIIAD
jgi:hypothetical protein